MDFKEIQKFFEVTWNPKRIVRFLKNLTTWDSNRILLTIQGCFLKRNVFKNLTRFSKTKEKILRNIHRNPKQFTVLVFRSKRSFELERKSYYTWGERGIVYVWKTSKEFMDFLNCFAVQRVLRFARTLWTTFGMPTSCGIPSVYSFFENFLRVDNTIRCYRVLE